MKTFEYYDSLENLTKSFSRQGLQVKIDKENLNVEFEGTTYTFNIVPTKLKNRSFSIAFFNQNGYLIKQIEQVSDEVLNRVNDACLEYSDLEIESIYRDMPLLYELGQENKGALKDVAIIWRDHFLEENVGLLNCLIQMGVKPSDILAIDKGDSTLHQFNIKNTFKKMGMNVNILDNSLVQDIENHLDKTQFVFDFINQRKNQKTLVIDDGALVTKILKDKFDNIVAFLELTEMGLRRINPMKAELLYPVLNVAKTTLKRKITYPEISNSIFLRVLELIGAEKLVGRNVLVLGYGDLGEILADRLRSFGINVSIYDTDIMKLIMAGEKGFRTFKDNVKAIKQTKPILIIGASGYKSISEEMVQNLPDYAFVTAGATADLSFFKQFENDPQVCMKVEGLGSQYKIFGKQITVLGNGRSVNLFGSEAIPNRANDVFKTAIALTAKNAIKYEKQLNNDVHLNTVEDWINESGILEKYYDKYIGE